MYIYALVDPHTQLIRYIGQTTVSLSVRLQQHLSPSCRAKKTYKANWIQSLWERSKKPKIVLLETCNTLELLDSAEIYWIAYLRCMGVPLTNITRGGHSQLKGYVASIATKEKLSRALTGRSITMESRALISKRRRGLSPSKDTRDKLRNKRLGRIFADATRQRMSETHQSKTGRLVDENGTVYLTMKAAVKRLKVSRTSLWKALKGESVYLNGHTVRRL